MASFLTEEDEFAAACALSLEIDDAVQHETAAFVAKAKLVIADLTDEQSKCIFEESQMRGGIPPKISRRGLSVGVGDSALKDRNVGKEFVEPSEPHSSKISSEKSAARKSNSLFVYFNDKYIHIQKLINIYAGRYKVMPSTRMARFMSSYSKVATPHPLSLTKQLEKHSKGRIQDTDIICIWKQGICKKKKEERIYTCGTMKYVTVIGVWSKSPKKKSGGFIRAYVQDPKLQQIEAKEKKGAEALGFGMAYIEMIEERKNGRVVLRYPESDIYSEIESKVSLTGGATFGVAYDDQFITHTGMSWKLGDVSVEVPPDVVTFVDQETEVTRMHDQKTFEEEARVRSEKRKKDKEKP